MKLNRITAIFRVGLLVLYIWPASTMQAQSASASPIRLAVSGITHGHVGWILGRKDKGDILLVGIYEPNSALAQRFAKQYNLSTTLFYNDLSKMLESVKPEAVVAFGSIYEHMATVEACAPRGIHVMVEKPLATTLPQAIKMEQLAKKNGIFLLTNYETSWYPTTEKTYQLVNDSNFVGTVRKVVIHDGHEGPKEIGVGKEFLDWLTDPIQNGGGALIDFGCYGANLMTYLMKGAEPLTVTAVTQQQKPAIYPKVDDEATIVVTYPGAQCIIQASWNWPFSRKDMEVYGNTGYIIAANSTTLRLRNEDSDEYTREVTTKDIAVYQDPFSYFADVLKGKIKMPENGLYSLKNNVTVVRILDAARESAATGKTIVLTAK
ncbi:MAG: Gfo/Idh/MocA family oxidoreductase [Cyclobacteriaceae bacterium]|nr:Gfo/Idh/MocA family oxidoreductase [Cyclobacteriaceae bacterium]MDH5250680.1 Gfo/Idh/MocA family oxidoreductase [Cyclobacteriaceae bacterium]